MCEICDRTKNVPEYSILIEKMLEEDKKRMEYSKKVAQELPSIAKSVYSSMNWPIKLIHPMFDARAAFAVPNNYFQNLTIDEDRLGNSFAHGAMRSVFFSGDRLILFSKTTNFKDYDEFFTTFILLHLEKGEYDAKIAGNNIRITAQVEKPMKNMINGKVEKKKISFSFMHQDVEGKIVSKDQAAGSSRFKNVYDKYVGAREKSASIDMEGYAITVPHFSPHPYMLQLHEKFGYVDNKKMQLDVANYFKKHLTP